MKLFIDSANPEEIAVSMELGYVDGVTTNPSLAANVGIPYKDMVQEILEKVKGPVSLETIATEYDGILAEGHALSELGENVVVKVPCISAGFRAVRELSYRGVKTNMTLCFSVSQALLAAKVGATYVSPFIGRVDDISEHGGDELIHQIRLVYDQYAFETSILAASIRDVEHVANAAKLGADVATLPFSVLTKLAEHPLTEKGLAKFLSDWDSTGLQLPI